MTVTFPLSLPTVTGIAGGTLRMRSIVGMSQAPTSGSQQVQEYQEWWEGEITLTPLDTQEKQALWLAFFAKLRGRSGTFLFGDPLKRTPRGVATGTPLVNGASQTGKILVTDGWTAGQTGIMKEWDSFQVGTGLTSRLHRILNDADSDGSGNATFDSFPRIRESPADNAPITLTDPKGLFRLAGNEMNWNFSPGDLVTGITFPIIEAL